jgi:hypothetical protein
MAALTSTQSGNFSSASTWGGTSPADGDTFTITAGHQVTVNSDIRTTNGYGDIVVYGNLHFATNGKMRLNGRITVKGYNTAAYNLSGGAWFTSGDSATAGLLSSTGTNMLIEARGSQADQHGIWIENERYASLKIESDDNRTTTTSSQEMSYNSEYITVSDDSGFASGDWIAIYKEQEDERVLGDEGMWVHDVDTANNRIYVRQFVCPSSTIENVSSNKIKVSDSRVFRKGYKVIAGTGSSRKVGTIDSINYAAHELTMSVNFVSANLGQTLYQTGNEKLHPSGKYVQKIATTLTTAITNTNSINQIVVGSANDISVGDTIIIDVNNDNDRSWNYDSEYTVTAKSGTTLTLDDQVRHNHKVGSLVQILDRNFVIKGVDSDSGTVPFLYVEYWTDYNNASTRHITLKNIRFTNFGGNTQSTYYRGVMIAGYNSRLHEDETTDNRMVHQSTIQGVVVDNSNNKQSYTGLSSRHPHSLTMRNNVCYNTGEQGIWNWSSTHNLKMYNNYVTRTAYSSIQQDANYEPYSEQSYNYLTRSDDYGYMFHNNREQTPFRHNYIINHEQRPMYNYYMNHEMVMERLYIDGFRYVPYIGTANGTLNFLDCYMDNRWMKSITTGTLGTEISGRYFGYHNGESRANYDRDNGNMCTFASYEHNFLYDTKLICNSGGFTVKDSSSSTIKVYNQSSSRYVYKEQVYVPAGVTVRISAQMKHSSTGSFTYSSLVAKNVSKYNTGLGRWRGAYTGSTSTISSTNKDFNGFFDEVSFTSASQSAFEEKQLTVQPQNKGYFMLVGIRSHDNAQDEVHELMPISILFDKATPIKKNNTQGKGVSVRSSFTGGKKRIGGTRL